MSMPKRGTDIDAPDAGAFYFEDAARLLLDSGYMIGNIEVTMPPREKRKLALSGGVPSRDEIIAWVNGVRGCDTSDGDDSGNNTNRAVRERGISECDGIEAGVGYGVLSRKYRVLRCSYGREAFVCDILIAPTAV